MHKLIQQLREDGIGIHLAETDGPGPRYRAFAYDLQSEQPFAHTARGDSPDEALRLVAELARRASRLSPPRAQCDNPVDSDARELKSVYVGMCADIIHVGHLNIIDTARLYGRVIVGLLTDDAIASYKDPPVISFEHRKRLVERLKGVDRVVQQDSLDYVDNLRKYRPDFLVHGDDWKQGVQQEARCRVIAVMQEWGGEVIEPAYTRGVSSTEIKSWMRRALDAARKT